MTRILFVCLTVASCLFAQERPRLGQTPLPQNQSSPVPDSQFERMLTPQPLAPMNGRPDPQVEQSRNEAYRRDVETFNLLRARYRAAHTHAVAGLSQAVETNLKAPSGADAKSLAEAAAALKPPFMAQLNEIQAVMPNADLKTPLSKAVEVMTDARLVVQQVRQSLGAKYPGASVQNALAIASAAFVPTQQEAVERARQAPTANNTVPRDNKPPGSPSPAPPPQVQPAAQAGNVYRNSVPIDQLRKNLEITLKGNLPSVEEALKTLPPDRPDMKPAMIAALKESAAKFVNARKRYDAANIKLETDVKAAAAAYTAANTRAYQEKLLDIEFRYRQEMLAVFHDSLSISTNIVIDYEFVGLKDAVEHARQGPAVSAAALQIAEKLLLPPPIPTGGYEGTGYWLNRQTLP